MEVGQLLIDVARRPIQPRHRWPATLVVVALALAGCGTDPEDVVAPEPTSPSSIDAPAEVEDVPPGLPELCESVDDDVIEDLTGVAVVGVDGAGDMCTWSLTESAAVLGGPNDEGEASLEATLIDAELFAEFEAQDGAGIEVVEVDDVGDDAFLVRRDGVAPSTLYVRDGERALSLALANVLDGGNATEAALVDLARAVLELDE